MPCFAPSATARYLLADPDVLWTEFTFTSRAPEGRPRYFFASAAGEPRVVTRRSTSPTRRRTA
jgi:hypothetical protein